MNKKKKINRLIKLVRVDNYRKSKAKRPKFTVDWTFSCNKELLVKKHKELIPLLCEQSGYALEEYDNAENIDGFTLWMGNYNCSAGKTGYSLYSETDWQLERKDTLAQIAAEKYLC